MVFSVNQDSRNFQIVRPERRWHVFITHGDRDKICVTTSRFKTKDCSFVAGEPARDRLRHTLWHFDLDHRTHMVGRPQVGHFADLVSSVPADRTVVLHAPCWKGERDSTDYGSVAFHGEALVITRPTSVRAQISVQAQTDESGYLGAAEWLSPPESSDMVAIVDPVKHDEAAPRRLEFWVERRFGDPTRGDATGRFLGALDRLLVLWGRDLSLPWRIRPAARPLGARPVASLAH